MSDFIRTCAITFDVDWAPEWAIEMCAELCERHSIKATFFVTHHASILQNLRQRKDLFELGIHPNFLTDSTHGQNPQDVLDHCMNIVPEARSMRTHSLVQSSKLFDLVADKYPMIDTDVSLFLPFHRKLHPINMYAGRSKRRLTRLPYFWEDDVAAEMPGWSWNDQGPSDEEGLQIYNFHPVHIALNTRRMSQYLLIKEMLGSRRLQDAKRTDFEGFQSEHSGARNFLESVVRSKCSCRFFTMSELSANWAASLHSEAGKC